MLNEIFSVVLDGLPRPRGDKKGTNHFVFLNRALNQFSAIEEAELVLMPSILPPSQVCKEKAELEEGTGILRVSMGEEQCSWGGLVGGWGW